MAGPLPSLSIRRVNFQFYGCTVYFFIFILFRMDITISKQWRPWSGPPLFAYVPKNGTLCLYGLIKNDTGKALCSHAITFIKETLTGFWGVLNFLQVFLTTVQTFVDEKRFYHVSYRAGLAATTVTKNSCLDSMPSAQYFMDDKLKTSIYYGTPEKTFSFLYLSEKKLKQENQKRNLKNIIPRLNDVFYIVCSTHWSCLNNIISRLNDLLCRLFKKIRKEIKTRKPESKLKQERQKGN